MTALSINIVWIWRVLKYESYNYIAYRYFVSSLKEGQYIFKIVCIYNANKCKQIVCIYLSYNMKY